MNESGNESELLVPFVVAMLTCDAAITEAHSNKRTLVGIFEDAPLMETQILFGIVRDPRVRLTRPIPIEVRREESSSIAFWAEAEEFGYGSDRSAAIEDFGRTISQLFVSLSKQEAELGPDLKRLLGLLRNYMKLSA